jgi:pimeloyl-ACP methyl ester carboxylesterase
MKKEVIIKISRIKWQITFVILFIFVTGCASVKYTTTDIEKEIVRTNIVESKFVKVGDYNIHYVEAGKGETIIMIHGWLCWGAYWKKIIPLVKENYHVYAPDLLGHGISDKPLGKEVSYGTDAQAQRIIAFMDKLGIKKAYIVGHSMGGEIAAKVTLLAPERVKGLVLISAAGMEKTPKLLPLHVRLGRAMHLENLAWMMNETIIRINTPSLMFYKENPMPDEFVNDIIMTNLKDMTDRKAMVKATKEGLFQNFMDERCRDIKVPTLVISAKYDRVVPPETQEQYSNLIPGAQYVCIDEAGHMVPWEQPQAVAANIINAMKKVPAD